MSEATTTSRVDFGVKMSALINAATSFNVIGTATVKTSKVLALGAILQGASTEDVSKRTGIAEGTLKRIAGLARNGVPAREGFKALTPAAISVRLHDLDWAALTASTDPDAQLDATYAAAAIWDDAFIETAKAGKSRKGDEPMTPTNLAILVHDSIVNAENPQVWIDAINDALASAEATLTDGEEEEDAA